MSWDNEAGADSKVTSDNETSLKLHAVDYSELMDEFRAAYIAADAELLDVVLGDGFEWHTHTFDPSNPVPTGRVIQGVAKMVEELEWRNANWEGVRFDGLVEYFAPKLITQSFTISGVDRGNRFHTAAIDIYTLDEADLIVKKDTYWKQAAQ